MKRREELVGILGGRSIVLGRKWQNDEGVEIKGVTHWMPLPKAPNHEK